MADDVNTPVDQTPTEPAPSAETPIEPAVTEDVSDEAKADQEIADDLAKEDDSADDPLGTEEPAPDEPEPPAEEPDEPKVPKSAEARKEQLNTEIRDLVAKRNELRAEVTKVNDQVYAPQTAEDLVSQGMDPALARVEALEQRAQLAEYNAHVTDLNANLNIESLQVMADFPIFNSDAPEYNKELADKAKAMYERVANIQTDPKTGLIIQANVLPYEIYRTIAEVAQSGAQQGTVDGQKAAEKNLAAADTVSSTAPKAPKEDLFLKGLMGESA